MKSSYTVIPERLMLDALDYAWFCYQTFFLKKLYQWGPHSFLTSHEMQRLVGKILRYANYFDAGDGIQHTLKRSFSETAEMLHCVLDAMGEGVRRLTSSPDFVRLRERAECRLADIAYRSHSFTEQMLGEGDLAPFRETVDSVWFVDNEKVIVVKDGVTAAEMRGCLDAVKCLLAPPESDIMVVSANIFRYMLQVSRPFLYMHLMVYGKIAYGQDVLSDLQPPAMSFFAYRVLEQTGTILTFPQSRTAILSSDSAWFFGRELASLLERALFLKMYLETGTIKPWYHELLEESRRRYPQYYEELQRLQENVDDVDTGTICRGSFRLLRSVTNDIHNHLKNDDMIANFFTNETTDVPLQ